MLSVYCTSFCLDYPLILSLPDKAVNSLLPPQWPCFDLIPSNAYLSNYTATALKLSSYSIAYTSQGT